MPSTQSDSHRFTIRWDGSMGCYRVSAPNLDEAEVVRVDALKGKLYEMELYEDLPDAHDLGYMAAWREVMEWLETGS